jgi:hypothetical protein
MKEKVEPVNYISTRGFRPWTIDVLRVVEEIKLVKDSYYEWRIE